MTAQRRSFWLIAANGSCARVLSGRRPNARLEEIDCLVNPSGRVHERDLISDRPGRFSPGGVCSSASETHVKEVGKLDFARNLAAYLESARVQGRFGQLAIVASPDLLGKLRKAMSRAVCETVIEEVCKDVTSCSVDNIQACLSVSARVVEGPAFNLH